MELLSSAITALPVECTFLEAAGYLTESIRTHYQLNGISDEMMMHPENRLTASTVIYSRHRNEIWMIGDCLCRFNGKTYEHSKLVDHLLSEIRADILGYLINKGHSIGELQERDLAREWLFPCLKDQCSFQNATDAGPYGYTVLDGFPLPASGIRVIPLPENVRELVLASDGYPYLEDTLEESERRLSELLSCDPLCCRLFKSTKGLQTGNLSFDDRSYLRLALT